MLHCPNLMQIEGAMPKIGMEPVRKDALIRAAIAEIGAVGSLDVTVGRIARRAGVSAALAHHYFGSKDRILLAAMRQILEEFRLDVSRRYKGAPTPRARLEAILEASFGPEQFDAAIVSAWLAFYVQAQRSPEAGRLLRVYARRLDSNLVHALRRLVPEPAAQSIAEGTAAMIDGLYIRAALDGMAVDRPTALDLVGQYLEMRIEKEALA